MSSNGSEYCLENLISDKLKLVQKLKVNEFKKELRGCVTRKKWLDSFDLGIGQPNEVER